MDLRWYYDIFRKSWLLILIGALIPGLVALVISLVVTPTYSAQAEVSLYKTKSELSFYPQYITLSEDDIVHYSNPDARRNTMVALAQSDQVFLNTILSLPLEMQSSWSLTRFHDTSHVDTSGNLIHLAIRSEDAEEAAIVSNKWAETFITMANNTFRLPDSSQQAILSQIDRAKAEYDAAQAALEIFLKNNQIDELNLLITGKEQAISALQSVYISANKEELNDQLVIKQKLPVIKTNTQGLRSIIASGPDILTSTNASQLSALLLEVGSLNMGVNLPVNLQLSIPITESTISKSEALSELDDLISALGDLELSLENVITNQSLTLLSSSISESSLGSNIQTIQSQLDPLNSQLESEMAKERELTDTRDLAWTNYLNLEKKKAENDVALSNTDTEVVIAAEAVKPDQPVSPKKVINTAIGLAFGLLVMVAFVVFRAMINKESGQV